MQNQKKGPLNTASKGAQTEVKKVKKSNPKKPVNEAANEPKKVAFNLFAKVGPSANVKLNPKPDTPATNALHKKVSNISISSEKNVRVANKLGNKNVGAAKGNNAGHSAPPAHHSPAKNHPTAVTHAPQGHPANNKMDHPKGHNNGVHQPASHPPPAVILAGNKHPPAHSTAAHPQEHPKAHPTAAHPQEHPKAHSTAAHPPAHPMAAHPPADPQTHPTAAHPQEAHHSPHPNTHPSPHLVTGQPATIGQNNSPILAASMGKPSPSQPVPIPQTTQAK